MSGDEPRELLLALVNPVEGRVDEFNEWYSTVHIPEVLALPGFVSAQRYDIDGTSDVPSGFRYATVYDIAGSALEARNLLFGAGVGMSSSLDQTRLVFAALTPNGERING